MNSFLPLLLRLFTLRHATQAWRQTLAITAIIAIGVGVVLAVRLANRAAAASFTHFTEAVAGSSDWIVSPAAGDFDESVLRRMRDALVGEAVFLFPVLESTAAEPPAAPSEQMEFGRNSYQVLGIDILALRNLSQVYNSARQLLDVPDEFAPVMESRVGRNIFWSVLEADDAVFVAERTARANGWRVGSRFDVIIEDRFMTLEVSGILPRLEGQPEPSGNLLVMDIAALQRVPWRSLESRVNATNAILREQSFSWLQMLDDIERVMPYEVRLTKITPSVTADAVTVSFEVVAKNRDAMLQFIDNLVEDASFRQPTLSSERTPEDSDTGDYLLTMRVRYIPPEPAP